MPQKVMTIYLINQSFLPSARQEYLESSCLTHQGMCAKEIHLVLRMKENIHLKMRYQQFQWQWPVFVRPMNLKPLVHVLLRTKMYLNYLEKKNEHASNTQY